MVRVYNPNGGLLWSGATPRRQRCGRRQQLRLPEDERQRRLHIARRLVIQPDTGTEQEQIVACGDLRRLLPASFMGPNHSGSHAPRREARYDGHITRRKLAGVMHQQCNPGIRW